MLKYLGMGNRPEDKVKVIFVPCYLDGRDGIMNKDYYDILLGQDLSVYASYYEPWGDVVMFYAPCSPNDSLYELGNAVSGAEHIENLSGTITVSAVEE